MGYENTKTNFTMISRKTLRAVAGIVLCGVGFLLVFPKAYREKTYLIPAAGCQLETTVVEKPTGASQGTVVLLHGISANKKIMSYLAYGFAEQNLRVYMPDLPGHGHSPGPFSPERAEQCGEALVAGLIARGMANPDRTIVAGHSMGGAIALRVGGRIPVAGVVAISPAPMRTAHGVSPEMLLFRDPPQSLPQNLLVISGSLEPQSMRGNAIDLVTSHHGGTVNYVEIPRATHVSVLFDKRVVHTFQEWSSRTLSQNVSPGMPAPRQFCGAVAGFVGLLFLANPFLREATRRKQSDKEMEGGSPMPWGRMLAGFAAAAIFAVVLLHFWNPLRIVHLFQGDYLAAFFLIAGIALLALRWKSLHEQSSRTKVGLLGGLFAGLLLFLLFSAWLELSLYEAWLTPAKWLRFPLLFLILIPYHFAEELCLGPAAEGGMGRRWLSGMLLRIVAWSVVALGVFYLHSGAFLMVLLGPYFALVYTLQRRGMDIVRQETGSAAAAAVFGAILLAGLCLVIFPVT